MTYRSAQKTEQINVMSLDKHSAPGPAAGYAFQFERALFWLARSPAVVRDDALALLQEQVGDVDALGQQASAVAAQVQDQPLHVGAAAKLLDYTGGWYGIIRLPDDQDDEALSIRLLREANVLVHPGYFYDFPSGNHFVISFLPPTQIFREAILKLLKYL